MMFRRIYSEETLGSYLQGIARTNYNNLLYHFGEPYKTPSPDGKVQVHWELKTQDGTIITIYDYKEDKKPEDITEWHIGGFSKRSLLYLAYALGPDKIEII